MQRALARTDQRFRHRSRAQSAHFDPLQPSAEEIAGFVSRTGKQRGPPDHFVSDQGRQDLFGIEEELDRADRAFVEDAEGHARPAPAAAHGGGRSDGEDRDGPRPLRPLPPASGARRCDAGRDLLRPDARASLSDPASPRQAGRSPNGSAGTGSKSCLKGLQEGQPRGLERGEACALGRPERRRIRRPLRTTGQRNSHCAPTNNLSSAYS